MYRTNAILQLQQNHLYFLLSTDMPITNVLLSSLSVKTIDLVVIDPADPQSVGKRSHDWWTMWMWKRDGRPFTGVSTNISNRAT
jgi:hypothetical protein